MCAAAAIAGPHGHSTGVPFYIAGDVDAHVQPAGWHDNLGLYRAYVVSLMCTLALAARARRTNSGNKEDDKPNAGWGRGVSAVVSIALMLLLVYGVSLTRATELDRSERTGWGLWMTVPFTYSCLLG